MNMSRDLAFQHERGLTEPKIAGLIIPYAVHFTSRPKQAAGAFLAYCMASGVLIICGVLPIVLLMSKPNFPDGEVDMCIRARDLPNSLPHPS